MRTQMMTQAIQASMYPRSSLPRMEVTHEPKLTEIRPGRNISLQKIPSVNASQGTIFFVHGGGGRKSQYREQITHFTQSGEWEIVAYDMFGHGDSAKPDIWEAYTTEAFIKDFAEVYRSHQSPVGKINVIIAHSYGISICVEWYSALSTTAKEFLTVSAFVLLGGSLQSPASHPVFYAPVWLLNTFRAWMSEPWRKMAFHPSTPEALVQSELSNGAQNPMYMMKALVRQMVWLNPSHLRNVRIPVLVINGDADGVCPAEGGRAIAKAIGETARFEEVKNAGHILMLEQAAAVNELIENFVQKQIKAG